MKQFKISVSPHVVSPRDTPTIMKGVIKALLPVLAASLYFYKGMALRVVLVSVVSCVLTELILQLVRKRKVRLKDYSAVITGLLFAFIMPPSSPTWMVALGAVVAIALGKEVFGGLGCNVFNPALLGRAFLMAAFPIALTTWTSPETLSAVTGATPLGVAKFTHVAASSVELLVGNVAGSLGESSALALLIGLAYMLYKKIIDYRIPLAYFLTVVVYSGIFHIMKPELYVSPVFHVLAGGFLIGAIFMATDPVTTPVTKKGRWVFGIGCGLVTITIRFWGGLPEGVMYSILLMNACTPLINKYTRPKRYGT